MPDTAGLVRELRAVLGAAWVDGAIAAGQRARREHAALVAAQGAEVADSWLRRQRWPQGRFWAREGGCEVGVRV